MPVRGAEQVLDDGPKEQLPPGRKGRLIDVAPGAENSSLANVLAELVRRNVGRDRTAREQFDRLRGAIALIADDHPTALTMRFDFGRLVVHDGVVGVPDITFRGALSALESLGELRVRHLRHRTDLTVYGLWTHPLMVRRLLRVLGER